MIVVKFFRHVSQRSLQRELKQGQEHRKEREYQVRQPDRSLLPVPDEVLQDAAETDAAKLDTRSDAAGPKNNPRSPRTAQGLPDQRMFPPDPRHDQVQGHKEKSVLIARRTGVAA
jgi:hypothetical protein